MTYTDLDTIHNPSAGGTAPHGWGDQVRTNQEWFVEPDMVKAVRTATQSIPDTTWTKVDFTGTDAWDTNSLHDPGSNPERINISVAGRYEIAAHVRFAANATGRRRMRIQDEAGNIYAYDLEPSPSSTVETPLTATVEVESTASGTTSLWNVAVQQTSGGNLNVTEAWFSMRWIARS